MLQTLRKSPLVVVNLTNRIQFPQKLKGTIVEKWADYWKNLFIDYRQMLQDLRSDVQDEPVKALVWSSGLATLYGLAAHNPSEIDFKDSLKRVSNEVIMVSEECRNPKAVEHLGFLVNCYNQGRLHYRNLGIISFMYTTEVNDACDVYKAQCSYLQPTLLSYTSRIVDIGFMGRWWNLFIKTSNYDEKDC